MGDVAIWYRLYLSHRLFCCYHFNVVISRTLNERSYFWQSAVVRLLIDATQLTIDLILLRFVVERTLRIVFALTKTSSECHIRILCPKYLTKSTMLFCLYQLSASHFFKLLGVQKDCWLWQKNFYHNTSFCNAGSLYYTTAESPSANWESLVIHFSVGGKA